jgi:hypothetical protein
MERVALILEETGERLGCMLNPASLVVQRRAGVRPRRAAGPLTGSGLSDDPLLFTGGGSTELQLDLLFDVTLASSNQQIEDVRELTGPLWHLAENRSDDDGYGSPARVRFVWGKAWNVPGVIVAVAERLEQFTTTGVPRRSWLRMRLRRVGEVPQRFAEPVEPEVELTLPQDEALTTELMEVYDVAGDEPASGSERLDQIAADSYGGPTLWRIIAEFNNIVDPLNLEAGLRLLIPPRSILERKQPGNTDG